MEHLLPNFKVILNKKKQNKQKKQRIYGTTEMTDRRSWTWVQATFMRWWRALIRRERHRNDRVNNHAGAWSCGIRSRGVFYHKISRALPCWKHATVKWIPSNWRDHSLGVFFVVFFQGSWEMFNRSWVILGTLEANFATIPFLCHTGFIPDRSC